MLSLVACAAVAGWFALRSPAPPPFLALPASFKFPSTFRDRVGQFIPRSAGWAWAWRLEGALFGKRKPVNVFGEIVSLSTITNWPLGAASFGETNGLQVWLLNPDQLDRLRKTLKDSRAEFISGSMISTADGVQAMLFQGRTIPGTGDAGLIFNCLPRIRADTTDLMMGITFSELETNITSVELPPLVLIRTNLNAALRLQVPKGKGFLLLDRDMAGTAGRHFGLIIDPL